MERITIVLLKSFRVFYTLLGSHDVCPAQNGLVCPVNPEIHEIPTAVGFRICPTAMNCNITRNLESPRLIDNFQPPGIVRSCIPGIVNRLYRLLGQGYVGIGNRSILVRTVTDVGHGKDVESTVSHIGILLPQQKSSGRILIIFSDFMDRLSGMDIVFPTRVVDIGELIHESGDIDMVPVEYLGARIFQLFL